MTLEGKHLEFRNLIFLYQCHAQRYNMNSTSGSVREWKKMFCIPLLTFYNLSTILYFLYPLDRFLQLREAINILNQAINIKVHCVQHSFSTADATEKYCKEGSMAIAFPWCSAPSVNQRYAGILYPFVNRRRTFFRRPISKTAKDKKKNPDNFHTNRAVWLWYYQLFPCLLLRWLSSWLMKEMEGYSKATQCTVSLFFKGGVNPVHLSHQV